MAEIPEAGKPAPVGSLERALDQVIDFLGRAEQTARGRALAIEARRLRAAVGNWRSIEPPDDVREEMIARVLRLANDAEEAVAEASRSPSVPKLPAAQVGRGSSPSIAQAGRGSSPAIKPPAEPHTDVSRYAQDPARPPHIPTLVPQIPDLDSRAAAQGSAPRPAKAPQVVITAAGPRLPSLQFERVAQPEPEVLEGELLDSIPLPRREERRVHYEAQPEPVEAQPLAPPPRPRMPSAEELTLGLSTPALQLEPGEVSPPSLPPSSIGEEAQTMLFNVPSGISSLQPISVVPARRPPDLDPNLVMITDPYSKRADAYRALRRKLASNPARIVAITSAKPKEGKTICAVNLAIALAESSPRNVLVLEANIRSPGLAETMKIDPQLCFTEQLRRHRKDPDEPWVVVDQTAAGPLDEDAPRMSTQGGSVHLLAVDPRAERPPMLDAVAFSKGIESLKRAGYEYIIVDTPAVLGTLDMQIIGDSVDVVIFTSIVKRSNRKSLREAIEQIKPAPVLGVVLLES